MPKYWIDPPQGYLFGFPKMYDPEVDPPMPEWLVQNGYPERDVNERWFTVRSWDVQND